MNLSLLLGFYCKNKSYTITADQELIWQDQSPEPTQEQIDQWELTYESDIKKQNCKNEAKRRIAEYDWVIDTETTPDLLNREDFIAYRSALRQLILNPVENPVFPEIPQEEWA